MSRLLERRLDEMEFQPEKVLYECFFDFAEVGRVHFRHFRLHECRKCRKKARDQPFQSKQKITSEELFQAEILFCLSLLSSRRDICNFPSLAKCFSASNLDFTTFQNGFYIIKFAPIWKIVISISEIVMHLFSI